MSSFSLFNNIILALFLKELKIRFSTKGYMTYFWVIGEPLLRVMIFIVAWRVLLRMTERMGISINLLIITGIVPYNFFSSYLSSCSIAVKANAAFLSYRQISVFSVLLSRLYAELFLLILTYISVFAIFAFFGDIYFLLNVVVFFFSFFLFIIFTFGLGLILCSIGYYFNSEITNFVSPLLSIGLYVSGIIFPINIVPEPFRSYLLYNPILQAIMLMRNCFTNYDPFFDGASLSYLMLSTIIIFFVGITFYFYFRKEFKKNDRSR